jgi:hypothetical protein
MNAWLLNGYWNTLWILEYIIHIVIVPNNELEPK